MRQESIYLSRALFLMRTLKNNTNKRCIHQYRCWCSVRGYGHRTGGGFPGLHPTPPQPWAWRRATFPLGNSGGKGKGSVT